MDECKHCGYRGDIENCKSVSCSKHKTWYAEEQQQEIDNLRAQLARCVEHYDDRINILREALESITNYWDGGNYSVAVDACEHARCISVDALETDDNYDEEYLMEGSIEKIKATAEVLRCAEELYQLNVRTPLDTESTTDLVKKHVNYVKSVVDAVRATKEAKYECKGFK